MTEAVSAITLSGTMSVRYSSGLPLTLLLDWSVVCYITDCSYALQKLLIIGRLVVLLYSQQLK